MLCASLENHRFELSEWQRGADVQDAAESAHRWAFSLDQLRSCSVLQLSPCLAPWANILIQSWQLATASHMYLGLQS